MDRNSKPDGRARSRTLPYAGLRLHRTSELRQREDWIEEALAHPGARVLPVWQHRSLVHRPDEAPRAQAANHVHEHADELVLLGVDVEGGESAPVLAADLSSMEFDAAQALVGEARFLDLRRVGPALGAQDAAVLSYARGMVHWHRTHRHCGRCGAGTVSKLAGMQRSCPDEACGGDVFPRIDPAVIVLVDDGGLHDDGVARCLLGRASGWPKGVYSTLAGFVEPGESLEETVAREVREESDVSVERIRYVASQPWPFPSSLMLGFRASARSLDITRHDGELEHARWFTAEELHGAGTWGDDDEICLPRHDSIARFLVEHWLAEQG